jgi:hypothetical protein
MRGYQTIVNLTNLKRKNFESSKAQLLRQEKNLARDI